MRSLWANLRLTGGCWALFAGVMLLGIPRGMVADEANWIWGRWLAVLVGGVGLAITLREVAYLYAVFMRAERLEK